MLPLRWGDFKERAESEVPGVQEEETVNNQSAESRWLCAATESRLKRLRCAFGQFTGAPASDNAGRVEVGIAGEPALPTGEDGLRRAIDLIGMAALRTFTRRVSGIYLDQRHASNGGFVGQKRSEFGGQLHYYSSIETKPAKSRPAESRRYPPQELI